MNERNPRLDDRHLQRCRHAGFTLIELLIVIVAIAVLASIAVPSYSEYVRRSRRADAQQFMQDIAARQQHYLLDRRRYAVSLSATAANDGLAMTIPTNVASYYNIPDNLGVNNAATPPTFSITAAPAGSQTGERCGTLTLTSSGLKSATGGANCW